MRGVLFGGVVSVMRVPINLMAGGGFAWKTRRWRGCDGCVSLWLTKSFLHLFDELCIFMDSEIEFSHNRRKQW